MSNTLDLIPVTFTTILNWINSNYSNGVTCDLHSCKQSGPFATQMVLHMLILWRGYCKEQQSLKWSWGLSVLLTCCPHSASKNLPSPGSLPSPKIYLYLFSISFLSLDVHIFVAVLQDYPDFVDGPPFI